jgi:hypothetical protein
MDPIYKKCLKIIEVINTQAIPTMQQSYSSFMKQIEQDIKNNGNLNQSRQFAVAAKEAYDGGLIDNKNVQKYLGFLIDTGSKLDNRSRYLTDLLESIKNRFIIQNKELSQKNHTYLNNMINSDIPAEELLVKLQTLGKDIQKVINEDIPAYQKEIVAYIKDAENKIVDDAFAYYNKIQKLDRGTLPAIRSREWTYLPNELFRTPGAFVNTSYDTV